MSGSVDAGNMVNLLNLLAPAGGTHGLKFICTLSGNGVSINWPGLMMSHGAWLPQAMMVDNTSGTSPVTVGETTFGWSRIVAAYEMRIFQFPAVKTPTFTFSSAGTIAPAVTFFDFPMFPDSSISPSATTGPIVTIGGQPVQVTLVGTMLAPLPVTYTAAADTTITVGGTQETLFAAGSITTGAIVTNPFAATEQMFINPTGGTCGTTEGGGVFALQAGQSFLIGPSVNAVTWNAATAGHVCSAVRY
jgi:hypothetical protein